MSNEMAEEVIEQKEFPFEYKVISGRTVAVNPLTKEELDMEIEKGYADMAAGRTVPAEKAFADIRKKYGL